MEPIDLIYTLLFWLITLAMMYRIGLLQGRKHADQILGIERKKALKRIQNQSNRNE